MFTRRRWLKVGLLGGGVLAAAGLADAWHSRQLMSLAREGRLPRPQPWPHGAEQVVGALAPVVLDGVCSSPAACQAVVQGVREAILRLSPAAQHDLGQLLSLLALAPFRGPTTGIWHSWEEATPQEIEAFLQRWRSSGLSLLQAGYHALHDLILAAWYSDPASWPALGYPGPPELRPA